MGKQCPFVQLCYIGGPKRMPPKGRSCVESGVQQVWLRLEKARLRAAEIAELAVSRIAARRVALGLALALTALFVAAGGLSPRLALVGLAGAVAFAAAWPATIASGPRRREPRRNPKPRRSGCGASSWTPCRSRRWR